MEACSTPHTMPCWKTLAQLSQGGVRETEVEQKQECSWIGARHCQSRTSPLLKLIRTTEHATYMYSTITELCQKYGKHIFLVNQSLKCSWLFIFWWKKYRIQQTMAHQRQPFCFLIECLIVILCTVIIPSPAPGQVRWKPVWTGGGSRPSLLLIQMLFKYTVHTTSLFIKNDIKYLSYYYALNRAHKFKYLMRVVAKELNRGEMPQWKLFTRNTFYKQCHEMANWLQGWSTLTDCAMCGSRVDAKTQSALCLSALSH